MPERYLTVKEVAEILKVSEFTIRRKIKDKIIRAVKVGRYLRISEDDLNEFLKRNIV